MIFLWKSNYFVTFLKENQWKSRFFYRHALKIKNESWEKNRSIAPRQNFPRNPFLTFSERSEHSFLDFGSSYFFFADLTTGDTQLRKSSEFTYMSNSLAFYSITSLGRLKNAQGFKIAMLHMRAGGATVHSRWNGNSLKWKFKVFEVAGFLAIKWKFVKMERRWGPVFAKCCKHKEWKPSKPSKFRKWAQNVKRNSKYFDNIAKIESEFRVKYVFRRPSRKGASTVWRF